MIFKGFRQKKIQVFLRHCFYSNASAHKKRDSGFSHEKCFENFIETTDFDQVELTIFLDTHFKKGERHFVQNQTRFPIVEIDAGTEAKAFLALLDYVINQSFPDETILYFLEDDYLHKEGWAEILHEGFSINQADYVTLFDHRDKYFLEMYAHLQCQLYHTKSCHWRTTPSTTNTYAMRMGTLKKHFSVHQQYSMGRKISADHEKFLTLGKMGAQLISPIPGWSTHAEPEFASPCYDWASLFSEKQLK